MHWRAIVASVATALVTVAAPASGSASPSTAASCNPPKPPPMPPAGDFVGRIDNSYFPLKPGTIYRYRGTEDGDRVFDKVVVTHQTKEILGVRATVVLDRVWQNGKRSEKTFDWYAQDRSGNVWYLGEAAFDFVRGHWERADDSWKSGVDGAKPGIIAEAHPEVGDVYAQEHYPGHALDMAKVVSTDATVRVPFGTFRHALKTHECTPLEQGVLDVKLYGRGVGEIREATIRGGKANLVLVSVTHAR
jgi:hypothetical protein